MPRWFPKLLILLSTAALTGCGANGGFGAGVLNPHFSSQSPSSIGEIIPVIPNPDHPPGTSELGICSELSLTDVTWPTALNTSEKRALALGLNISGSFEGDSGWSNLTNNFDGQGISFGLLNQNVGAGSVQPLWIKMRDRYPAKMKSLFSAAHYSSLAGMLANWEKASSLKGPLNLISNVSDGRLSILDVPVGNHVSVASAESSSVSWAVSSLYTDSGKTFQAAWKSELLKLADAPDYVSIQIEASENMHTKAVNYMTTLKLKELRSYLFLFDINVQNGSLYQEDIDDYKAYFGTSAASESQRLAKILDLRLRHVKSEYVTDVRTRKLAIINGSGTVHGSKRNFETEYCFERGVSFSTN